MVTTGWTYDVKYVPLGPNKFCQKLQIVSFNKANTLMIKAIQ